MTASPGPIADFDELYEFVSLVNIAQSGRAIVSRDVLEAVLTMPEFDQQHGIQFVRDAAGSLVGVAWVQTRSPFVDSYLRGMVDPDRLGEGIGSFLADWALDLARQRIELAPEGALVAAKTDIDPQHAPSVSLFTERGFTAERYFLEMRVDFEGKSEPPRALPEGFRFVEFDPESDLERLFDVIDEAFDDHYGYVERPREEDLERFSRLLDRPSFDPSLVWMILEGEEAVGSNICVGNHEGDEAIGYVANLAVRRPWRGRGLAKTMLEVCFAEFLRRGKKGVALYVDADNTTGATRLYESVGMREVWRSCVYARELRPGERLTVA